MSLNSDTNAKYRHPGKFFFIRDLVPSRSREVEPLEVSEIFKICALHSGDHFAVSEFQDVSN